MRSDLLRSISSRKSTVPKWDKKYFEFLRVVVGFIVLCVYVDKYLSSDVFFLCIDSKR